MSLTYDEQQTFTFAPQGEEAFAKFAPGTKHSLHTEDGAFTVDGVLTSASR